MKNARLLLTSVACMVIGLLPSCGTGVQKEQAPLKYAIIDTLAPELFAELHLQDALNIPYALEDGNVNPAYKDADMLKHEIEKKTGRPLSRDTKLFFYCADDMCTSSKIAADLARSWGYDAHEYDSGLKGWFALSLYDVNKDNYQLAPRPGADMIFKKHTYLNQVVESKPDEATLTKWRQDAQPLLEAMKRA